MKYRYEAGAWPAGWNGAAYDDEAWTSGPAPLGFGVPAITTSVDVPPPTSNRPLSMLYRHAFTVDDPTKLSEIVLTVEANDGAIVWVNGAEVGRQRFAAGTVSAFTYANAAPRQSSAAQTPIVVTLPASALVVGTNTIAVSTHLNYRATSDAFFDAELTALRAP